MGSVAGPRVRESLPARVEVEEDSRAARLLGEVWDHAAMESRAHARQLRRVIALSEDLCEGPVGEGRESFDREACEYALAQALRSTIGHAGYLLEEALRTTQCFPTCLGLMETGELPLRWMRRVLRVSGALSETTQQALDKTVGGWDLRIGEDSFRRRLSLTVRHLRDLDDQAEPPAVPERSVTIGTPDQDDGTACLFVQGPAPEILALGHRLDAAARAIRTRQRERLAHPEQGPVPFDDGTIETSGEVMTLGRLRYEVLTRSMLDTSGIEVPAERFRLNVTVPALTLLGLSEAPGMLDGIIPIPAAMARDLAAGEPTWYRVLTDPAEGTFLPLPAQRYQPTARMLEHLRLRNPVCAVPGCTRGVRHGAEADHITEYDHEHPELGGLTEVENLHLLCTRHHQMKTAGTLRPHRDTPTSPRETGTTTWWIPRPTHTGSSSPSSPVTPATVRDDTDLMTPDTIRDLETQWGTYLHRTTRPDADPENAPDTRATAAPSGTTCTGPAGNGEPAPINHRAAITGKHSSDARHGTGSGPGDPPGPRGGAGPPLGTDPPPF